jgi:hypothetical protein
VAAYQYRFERVWRLFSKLPEPWNSRLRNGLDVLGLRAWDIRVYPSLHDNQLESISVRAFVTGRYETLGASWLMADHAMKFAGGGIEEGDPQTLMHWYHITSYISGEGYRISVTPRSSEEELWARHINGRCLVSFRGCDGLCDLLPDAARLLNKRHSSFGGCTGVPKPSCEIQNDDCRDLLKNYTH